MFLSGGGCGFMSSFITSGRMVKFLGSLALVRILLIMAGVEQNPGPTDKYIFRYQYLLVEIGTNVMRKVFDFTVGSDFVKHLSANNNKFNKRLQSLISAKIITADQAQYLPPIDNSPQSTNFDITLLACLLRNVCGLRGQKDPVWKNPPPTDLSLEADLARLKECRNNLQHIGTVFISEADLTVKWNELSQVLNRLNTVCGISNLSSLINNAESMDIDEELKKRHDQSVKAWTDMDHLFECGIEELKLGQSETKHGQLEIRHGLTGISQSQSEIKHGQSEISQSQSKIIHGQSEISQGQTDIIHGQSEIKHGQSEIKHGQSEISQSQSELKHGQSEIKHGQSEIKHGQSEISQSQSELKHGQSEIKHGQSEIKHCQSEIKHGQSEISQSQSEIKHGQFEISQSQSEIKHGQSEIKHGQSEIKHDQSEIKHCQSEIKHGQSEISQCQSEIKHGQFEISQSQSEIKHGQSEIKHSQSEMSQNQSKIQHGQSEIKHGQSEISQNQIEIKHGQSDIIRGLSEINVIQSEMKHDLPVLKKSLENVERRQKEQTERMEEISTTLYERKPTNLDMESDLRNRLVEIYRDECCTLLVSPLYDQDEDEVEILSIYEPPSLYHVPYNRPPNREEKEETYSVSSYKEMFCKDDRSFRKIYITGDAGVGKTSFCRRMSFLWCKSQLGESVSDKSVQNDIDFMSKFDFVFYVSLRDTHRKDVVTMIVEQLLPIVNDIEMKETYEFVENVLRKNECIIIMDGLDEWTPKVSGKININQLLSDKCIFVTTCRPYKLENERLSPRDIDRQVQITGINESSIKRYVTEILNHVNKANRDNKNPDDFIRDVRECGLHGQLHIPIITSHLVAVWFDHKLTDMSRALIYSNIVDMLLKRAEKGKHIELPSSAESEVPFPDCLSELFYFKKHISFLKKICLLSFNLLFQQDKCLSELVFTAEQLESEPYCVSPLEMDFLCKLGILSKSKVIGRFGKRGQKLSYLHKTYIEYFAALFISSVDLNNAFDDVVKKWKSINDVVQFENVFLFFVGLSCQKNNNKVLLENIYHTILYDLRLYNCDNNIRLHCFVYSSRIGSLQRMVKNLLKEVGGSKVSNTSLKLEDFDFGIDGSLHNVDSDLLKQLLLLNALCEQSIYAHAHNAEFDQVQNLQCLLVDASVSDFNEKVTEYMLQNQSTLHTVGICGAHWRQILFPELPVRKHNRFTAFVRSLFKMQPVRSLEHLTSLSLSDVTMQHNSLHNLVKFLSDNVLIEIIKLTNVFCDNHFFIYSDCILALNLPHHTNLISLYMENVNILCNKVNTSSLQYISLEAFSPMFSRYYLGLINCIQYSQLEHLFINALKTLDYNTMKRLACAVKTLPCIKLLKLRHMKLPDDVLLQLHPDVTQVEIILDKITMSRQCFHCFIQSVVSNNSVMKVYLRNCKITLVVGETLRVLPLKESVDYMSEYLTSLPTVNITQKEIKYMALDFETRS